jgi:hypothetical protein
MINFDFKGVMVTVNPIVPKSVILKISPFFYPRSNHELKRSRIFKKGDILKVPLFGTIRKVKISILWCLVYF